MSIAAAATIKSSEFSLFLDILNVLLNKAVSDTNNIIIGGDFNINFISNDSQVSQLNDLLTSFNLHVAIDSPTRLTDTSTTCIDNFLVSIPRYSYTTTCIDSNISDHLAITIEFPIVLEKYQNILYKRNLNQSNRNYFLVCLQNEPWQEVYAASSCEVGFNALYDSFTHFVDTCFPYCKCFSRTTDYWVTDEIFTLRDQLFLTKELAVRYPIFKDEYRNLEKHLSIYYPPTKENL